tara:strand:+ start:532 stop:930 length:399 start_codon:yes stop_codon:yes gene_type:complete
MLLFNNLDDINAVYGLLSKVADEVNDYYWHNDNEIDPERAVELEKLRNYLVERGYIDKNYDLARLTYSFHELYPASPVTQENDRQYHSVLNKLDDDVRRSFLWDIRNMEKDTEEKVDKSVKFDMALKLLLNK